MERPILDKVDLNILATLARDCRTSYKSIGSLCGLTSKSVKSRVKNMVRSGIIEKFIVRVNPAGFGYRTAHVLVMRSNGYNRACKGVWRSCISCASYGKNFNGCSYNQKIIG